MTPLRLNFSPFTYCIAYR